jgi:hypothetical protein
MKKLVFLLIFMTTLGFSQTTKEKDGYYLEDQIYFGFTYNVLRNLPNSIKQSGFSNGLSIGFIKDLPVNKQRNFGFGAGLGYGMDTYFHNIKIYEDDNGQVLFENFQDLESPKNNKLILHSIEVPLEIRLRTSTIDDYRFWRLYFGLKFKYIFYSRASFKLDGLQKVKNLNAIEKLQYGLTISAGNGTWNFFTYYGLNPIFKNANLNNSESIDFKDLKVGIQFYIL